MVKPVLILVAVLAGGLAVAYLAPQELKDDATNLAVTPALQTAEDAPLAARVQELERVIAEERQARQLLQEELLYLTEEIELLRDGRRAAAAVPADSATVTTEPAVETRRERFARRNSPEFRTQRLIDAGFSPERAELILQREAQARLSMMEARYAAQRSGDDVDYRALRQADAAAFRNELGPVEYERYLEGTGRSTAVVVGSVLDTSPAQQVGLQPGDRIVNYDGTRIYNMSDLNQAMLAGQAGETVAAQIIRDGVTMQVAVRRGPLGITAGRGGRR
ncbi:MAG: PDZ domain-containing protein [Woeseia sp.]|nr:PDZ domain-containing protein [Woeseia sp.]MBT8097200.1 PDZ domain-containing protein [Woeseia sp.]NNE60869.1 PDZ domain-containing protein [Woeseia sp.]NNL55699.1 PDZ domain-containing protein [Woeseia sp.]